MKGTYHAKVPSFNVPEEYKNEYNELKDELDELIGKPKRSKNERKRITTITNKIVELGETTKELAEDYFEDLKDVLRAKKIRELKGQK